MRFFLVIGAQKAGTSWLHEQLLRHPQVHLPEWKELHYFDISRPPFPGRGFTARFISDARTAVARGNLRWAERVLEVLSLPYQDADGTAYREYLTRDAAPEARVAGEITPAYATLTEDGFRLAHEVLEAPRVVFVMRDPLERLWSQHRMQQGAGATLDSPVLAPGNWARCDYAGTIRRLESVFAPELVHYAFYEDLFSAEALGDLARFLGVDPVWEWDLEQRVLAGPPVAMPEPGPALVEQLAPVYAFVRERFGDRVPASWRA